MKDIPRVEVKDKILLTIEEAAAYSGISATTIRGRLREGDYDFILKNGTKTMIKRRRFEKYLENVDAI
ncbi:MAG: helix-turn-helix domain-containing protein [Lachnospiraceae bacterium]|nr:helix-turn-helix domain-containing protein [Lachnospiraceae bacterium]